MSNQEGLNSILFDMPKNQSNVIKVVGVGGGGSNAINHMFQQGIKGVDFVICNTDAQALENSGIPNKIQLGVSLTEGLGAGANPEVGEKAALESYEDIKNMLGVNTKMVFITAGMGGGTGTGAAPVIAKMARELDILTVGIVTIPFQFEGKTRNEQAQLGVEKLRNEVDSLIVINNNKLREVYGNLGFKAGFSKADEVLATASRGIAEVITHHYTQNIDLRDAKTVLKNSGTAIMGSASASGDQRAHIAISKALDSPLLNDNKITGAKNVLLLIVSGKEEITIDEIGEINDFIQQEAGNSANIIMGVGDDETLDDSISVTVIATGFNKEQQNDIVNTETKKIIHSLNDDQKVVQNLSAANTGSIIIPKTAKPIPKEAPRVTKIIPESKYKEPVIVETKSIAEKKEVIVHTLEEDQVVPAVEEKNPIIPSTNFIKNINVVDAEEIIVTTEPELEDDFVIIEAPNQFEEVEATEADFIDEDEERQQMTFTFDLPISKETKNIEVTDFEEVKSEPIMQQEAINEVVRYQLEDEDEEVIVNKKVAQEEEVVFERKTISEEPETDLNKNPEDGDPIELPISEVLKARASERRAKMKDFNYKFRSAANQIDDIEKQPAYKRAGLELNDPDNDVRVSRTALTTDSNDDLQLRKNNSFLHDNVD